MKRSTQLFAFVAGEQVIRRRSTNAIDAWLMLTVFAAKNPIADEFRCLSISCFDESGDVVGCKAWEGWQSALLQDTYGQNWPDITDSAAAMV